LSKSVVGGLQVEKEIVYWNFKRKKTDLWEGTKG